MDLGSPDLAPRAPLTRHPPAPPDLNLRSRTCLRVPPENGEARGAANEESPRQPAARPPARLPSVPESFCPAGANASVITASVTTASVTTAAVTTAAVIRNAVVRAAVVRAAVVRAAVIRAAGIGAAEKPAAEEPQPGGIAARDSRRGNAGGGKSKKGAGCEQIIPPSKRAFH